MGLWEYSGHRQAFMCGERWQKGVLAIVKYRLEDIQPVIMKDKTM